VERNGNGGAEGTNAPRGRSWTRFAKTDGLFIRKQGTAEGGERRADTLFWLLDLSGWCMPAGGEKNQRAQEKQEFVRWKLEQTEKIAAACVRERKNWLKQHPNVWEWPDFPCWKEEIWQTPQRDTLWVTWGTGKRKSEIVYSMEQLTSRKEREEIETFVESHRWQEQVPVNLTPICSITCWALRCTMRGLLWPIKERYFSPVKSVDTWVLGQLLHQIAEKCILRHYFCLRLVMGGA